MQLNEASFDDGSVNLQNMFVIHRKIGNDILVFWDVALELLSTGNSVVINSLNAVLNMRFGFLTNTTTDVYYFEEIFEYKRPQSFDQMEALSRFPAIVPYVDMQGARIAATLIDPFDEGYIFPIEYEIHDFYLQNETFEMKTRIIEISEQIIGDNLKDYPPDAMAGEKLHIIL